MRKFLYAAALCLAAFPALAADVTSAWVRQLALDGYEEISIGKTWLGRTRILAEKGDIKREIVLNTRTGEVLRDYTRAENGLIRLPLGFDAGQDDNDDHSGTGGGNSSNDDSSDDSNDDSSDDSSEQDSEDSSDSEDGGEQDEQDEQEDD